MLLLIVCKAPAACRKTSREPDTLESQGSGIGTFYLLLIKDNNMPPPSEERRKLCFPLDNTDALVTGSTGQNNLSFPSMNGIDQKTG